MHGQSPDQVSIKQLFEFKIQDDVNLTAAINLAFNNNTDSSYYQ
jgi:hypothetical protein